MITYEPHLAQAREAEMIRQADMVRVVRDCVFVQVRARLMNGETEEATIAQEVGLYCYVPYVTAGHLDKMTAIFEASQDAIDIFPTVLHMGQKKAR